VWKWFVGLTSTALAVHVSCVLFSGLIAVSRQRPSIRACKPPTPAGSRSRSRGES
jgi:hypothetical protein